MTRLRAEEDLQDISSKRHALLFLCQYLYPHDISISLRIGQGYFVKGQEVSQSPLATGTRLTFFSRNPNPPNISISLHFGKANFE